MNTPEDLKEEVMMYVYSNGPKFTEWLKDSGYASEEVSDNKKDLLKATNEFIVSVSVSDADINLIDVLNYGNEFYTQCEREEKIDKLL